MGRGKSKASGEVAQCRCKVQLLASLMKLKPRSREDEAAPEVKGGIAAPY